MAAALTFGEWLEAYGRAWLGTGKGGVAELFTEDAAYWAEPFAEPHVGHDAIHAYWYERGHYGVSGLRFGEPVAAGQRAAVEWWAVLDVEGFVSHTVSGVMNVRRAEDGRCAELRAIETRGSGERSPAEGWGT